MRKFTLFFVLLSTLYGYAQDGVLDPTFGNGGKVITNINNYRDQEASSITVQKDNKIVMTGWFQNDFGRDFVTFRYNTDGSLDSTYNNDGIAITSLSDRDYGASVAVQEDGKIVVAGSTHNGNDNDFAVLRYNIDGSLDFTFNDSGIVITPIGEGNDYGRSISIQQDGKIVVAGSTFNGKYNDFAVVRYNIDGSLDFTFNDSGIVITPIGEGYDSGNSISIQQDGKIVVAGSASNGNDNDFAVVRYNIDGSLDSTFNKNGTVTTSIGEGSDESGRSVAIHDDGAIVVAGQNESGSECNYAIVQYNNNGTLDSTFNKTGQIIIPFCSSCNLVYDGSVIIQSDGKIIFGGTWTNGSNFDFMLIRYNSYGVIDSSFGDNGMILTDFDNEYNFLLALNVQDDKIVAAGMSLPADISYFHIAVARYNVVITDIKNISERFIPFDYKLQQNFPNPFNPNTTIKYNLPKRTSVSLKIYNLAGQLIKTLVNEKQQTGSYIVKWNGNDEQSCNVTSGVYLCRLQTNEFVQTRKMILVR